MRFSITGVNHRTAPVEVREMLAFNDRQLSDALVLLKQRPGVREGLILSTCNRVEVALASEDEGADPGGIEEFLAETRSVSRDWLQPYLYRYDDREAIRHLFRVASSLDSMVLGEPQILGQLKAAYALAKEQGAVSGFLDGLLSRAFNVAKRVRSETEIGESAVSVSFAAVELAREIFGSLAEQKVMIAGAGKMSEAAARHLRRCGASQIFVTNRTPERAAEVAAAFGGSVVDYSAFTAFLPEIDILITSSGAPHFLVTKEDMKRVLEARKNRPVFLIDIAVPRNIEPAVNQLEGVFLYDIDDLKGVVDRNIQGRAVHAENAEVIIAEEVERMVARLKSRDVAPTIVGLQEQLESVRQAEMARYRSRMGALTPDQEHALEMLTRSIINKIAHGPISELRKQASQPEGSHFVTAIRRVFRLGD